jgi:transposase
MMGLSTTHQGGALTMKFKQIDTQNQRVEKITTSHLVVGIDMAKEIHVAQATNFRGIVFRNVIFRFPIVLKGLKN